MVCLLKDISDVPGLPDNISGLVAPLDSWDQCALPKRAYAILLLFLSPALGSSQARILFTRRSVALKSHPGQISFPGGKREPYDLNPTETALREAHEEIGIEVKSISIMGALPCVTSLAGDPVFPVVGKAAVDLSDLTPNQREVDEIFLMEWSLFVREKCQTFSTNLFGIKRESKVFMAMDRKVWGLTAQVLYMAGLQGKNI